MIRFDLDNCRVFRDDVPISLPKGNNNYADRPLTWYFIKILANAPDDSIVYYDHLYGDTELLQRHIRHFLTAIGENTRPRIFQTEKGIGYRVNKKDRFYVDDNEKNSAEKNASDDPCLPCTVNGSQVQTTPEAKLQYYESLWQKYIHLEFRDGDQGQHLELFDGYIQVSPSRVAGNIPDFNGFARNSKNLILSPSGLGKTFLLRCLTLLQVYNYLVDQQSCILSDHARSTAYLNYVNKLQHFYLVDASYFPIHITCGDIHNKGEYEDVLQLAEGFSPESSDVLCNLVTKAENLFLMVDSVDEIVDNDIKRAFFEKLSKFLKEHTNSTVVITSRPIGLPGQLDYYSKYQLPLFGIPEIQTLTEKLLNSAEDNANMVVSMINANPCLRELAANPYMATVILAKDIKENTGLFPVPCLHDIVNKIIKMRWDAGDEMETVKKILANAAWYILVHQSPANCIDQNQLQTCVEDVLSGTNEGTVKKISKIILYSSGILTMQTEDHRQKYSFQNEILLRYFAADYIHRYIFEGDGIQEENRTFENVLVFFSDVITKLKRNLYSETVLQTLAMATVLENSNAFPWWKQRVPLLCLLDLGISSINDQEDKVVAEALAAIVNKLYNENDVTNSDDRGDLTRIHTYLERLSNDIKDIPFVKQCYYDVESKLAGELANSNLITPTRR